jgi:integrase
VYLGRDLVSGRKRYSTRSMRGPRRDAERLLREMVAAAEAGVTHRAGATFGELCETWLAHAKGHLAPNTVVETRRILDRVLLPALGGVPLCGLRPEHLDELYVRLLRDGVSADRPLSASSVRRVHGIARRALTVGVRWGWLTTNPAFVAMPPRTIRRPIRPPRPDDVVALVTAANAKDPGLGTFLTVAATTGARRGELCGLRWSDLDTDTGQLDIVRAMIVVAGRCVEAPTKSRQCRRVAIDPFTLDALAEHRARTCERASHAHTVPRPDAFMFSHDPDGTRPWRPDSVTRAFRRLCTNVRLDNVRFHDLRHYVATRLLVGGIDLRTVAGRLGHTKAGTTLNIYAAFVPDADREAASLMAQLLATPPTRP